MDLRVKKMRIERWLPIFEEQAKSGLTKKEWCDQNGIRKWEFFERQRECREYILERAFSPASKDETTETLPAFFEVPNSVNSYDEPSVSTAANSMIEVSCNGFQIKLDGHVNPETLCTLIRVVSNV